LSCLLYPLLADTLETIHHLGHHPLPFLVKKSITIMELVRKIERSGESVVDILIYTITHVTASFFPTNQMVFGTSFADSTLLA
jgi:hypothetical protein